MKNKPGFFSAGLRKGMRVRIPKWSSNMKHRKNRNGEIVCVNGAYVLVRPMWCKYLLEFYPNELRVIK